MHVVEALNATCKTLGPWTAVQHAPSHIVEGPARYVKWLVRSGLNDKYRQVTEMDLLRNLTTCLHLKRLHFELHWLFKRLPEELGLPFISPHCNHITHGACLEKRSQAIRCAALSKNQRRQTFVDAHRYEFATLQCSLQGRALAFPRLFLHQLPVVKGDDGLQEEGHHMHEHTCLRHMEGAT